jgi:release factor glutamine methyltransferase
VAETVAELTVGAALVSATARLAAAGCDTPRLDAELLLASVLGVGRERLILDRDAPLTVSVEQLLARREAREPVAYILGRKQFRRLTLEVDPRVLIPRPETELLVELGLELAAGSRVADVGTGSGAVALALKDERPDLVVRGFDVSPGAIDVARRNAARLGLDVEFDTRDLIDEQPYDAVLANLPYVREGASLAPEIELYEPRLALFAGEDGLGLIRRLIAVAAGRTGLLALELDPSQAEAVASMLREAGMAPVEIRRDLAGRERVVVGRERAVVGRA